MLRTSKEGSTALYLYCSGNYGLIDISLVCTLPAIGAFWCMTLWCDLMPVNVGVALLRDPSGCTSTPRYEPEQIHDMGLISSLGTFVILPSREGG